MRLPKKVNPLIKFIRYFWGPIPWLIEVAIILSSIIQHWEDLGIITALLVLNAVVGFWQEHKADNAIELLKEKLALKPGCCVTTNGMKYLQKNLFQETLST